ncbi:unnamed protein product [Paramecium pentaurelia]|uniref:AB hydrolase-1 domain-containing protein n=1 Tax=Paramecium pentaurelia TaxID=43138 RepID=A0A8S1VGZ5_9CILI|nr:unnamed protein product [Paramecium pentaurelia]
MLNCSCKSSSVQMTEEQKKELRWKKEIDLLEYYKIKIGLNCFLYDYEVEYQGKQYQIHTFCGGESDKEIILMLHGYGGSNVHYCRIYEQLIRKFRIYSIDLPGMGYSSKSDILMESYEDAIEFFMGTISKFIENINREQKIILIGHSFGGFLAAHLFTRMPHLFSKLFLLSPAGGTYYDDSEIKKLQDTSKYPFLQRIFFNYAYKKWSEQITPQQLKDKWYGNYFIKKYLKKRMSLQGREYEVWQSYVDEMLALPDGSEKALFLLLQFPRVIARGWDSIEYILTKHSKYTAEVPIYFYFGDQDWMDKKGAYNLAKNNNNIKIRIIENAGHQLNFENPKGVYEQLFIDIIDSSCRREQQIMLS